MELKKLYTLIINSTNPQETIANNIELWKEFYLKRTTIIKNNITDSKLYIIIEFLLKNELGQICKTFQEDILDILIQEEQHLVLAFKTKILIDMNEISIMYNLSNFHNRLSNSLKKTELPEESEKKSSVSEYKSEKLNIELADSLITVLYQNFFIIEPDIVEKIINCIEEITQTTIIPNSLSASTTKHINYMYQYIQKFIPILQYTGKSIKKSSFVSSILNGKIKDEEIIYKFFEGIPEKNLKEILDDDLNKLINLLEIIPTFDESLKRVIVRKVINNFLYSDEEKKHILLNYYIKNPNNEFLNPRMINELIKFANTCSFEQLNIEVIYYLLDSHNAIPIFIYNLNELIKSNQTKYSQEEIKNISEKLKKYNIPEEKKYSLKESIKLLNEYLDGKTLLDINTTRPIIKSIIKELNKYMELDDISVYFINSSTCDG